VASHKRTVANLGVLVFEDKSGQGLRPRKGRTWGRRGQSPVVTVTGGSDKRVEAAALIVVKAGAAAPADLLLALPQQGQTQRPHRGGLRPATGRRPPAARRPSRTDLG
jgi:hypothetical protein